MGKRGPTPKGRVTIEWSPRFAYALGLLASDGSLSKDGRHFDFTSKDKDLATLFQKALGLEDIKIGEKFSYVAGNKNVYYRIQFGDVNFYAWCLDCGFTPNKSRSVAELKIPDIYFFDFLRGCFDGDGTVHSSWDTRWKSSYAFYISFTSGSEKFLFWIQNVVTRLLGAKGYITAGGGDTYQLRYAKKETKLVCDRMYKKENLFRLERKFAKIQKIIMIDMYK
jgi:hypothetical protein